MKPKFEGPDGRRRLTEALKAFRLVEHDESLARRLAAEGELLEISEGTTIIEQKTLDDSLYFLIFGEVDVFVNGRHVATRYARETIGEIKFRATCSAPRRSPIGSVIRATFPPRWE